MILNKIFRYSVVEIFIQYGSCPDRIKSGIYLPKKVVRYWTSFYQGELKTSTGSRLESIRRLPFWLYWAMKAATRDRRADLHNLPHVHLMLDQTLLRCAPVSSAAKPTGKDIHCSAHCLNSTTGFGAGFNIGGCNRTPCSATFRPTRCLTWWCHCQFWNLFRYGAETWIQRLLPSSAIQKCANWTKMRTRCLKDPFRANHWDICIAYAKHPHAVGLQHHLSTWTPAGSFTARQIIFKAVFGKTESRVNLQICCQVRWSSDVITILLGFPGWSLPAFHTSPAGYTLSGSLSRCIDFFHHAIGSVCHGRTPS